MCPADARSVCALWVFLLLWQICWQRGYNEFQVLFTVIPTAWCCWSIFYGLHRLEALCFHPVPLSVPCQHRPALRVGKSTAGPTWTCNIADKYIQGEWVRYTHAHCTLYLYLYLYDDGLSYKCPFQSLWSLSKTNWRMVHPQHVENIVPSVDDALTEEVFPNV